MVDMTTTVLAGMEQIRQIIPRSASTVLDLKAKYPNMPIHRENDNGEWLSDREELLKFWRLYVQGKAHLYGRDLEDDQEKPDKSLARGKKAAEGGVNLFFLGGKKHKERKKP